MVAPYSYAEALQAVSAVLALPGIHLLPTPVEAISGWLALLRRHPVKGAGVFDLQIVANLAMASQPELR